MGRLEGKCALITGGGRGIGAETARTFVREGARVAVLGKGEASLAAIRSEIEKAGGALATFVGDVADEAEVRRAVDGAASALGGLDILVNNAGMTMPRPFVDKTIDEWRRVLEVNLIGAFLCSQAAARHMLAAGAGKIVNVTSVRALEHCGRAPVMDYSAAKAGLVNLTKTLAKELAPKINVNAVAPGHTETDILKALSNEVRGAMLAGTPLARFGQPSDIAAAILFLASKDADFITGHQLVVDGGFSLKAG